MDGSVTAGQRRVLRGRTKPVIQVKESDIQRCILDWLAAERIWHIRLNTGAMAGSHKGKKWFVRFGRPGMADILAVKLWSGRSKMMIAANVESMLFPMPIWIEVKAPKGQQTIDQKLFEQDVKATGQQYVLAHSLEDVIAVLK